MIVNSVQRLAGVADIKDVSHLINRIIRAVRSSTRVGGSETPKIVVGRGRLRR